MADNVERTTLTYPSADGKHQVHAYVWEPIELVALTKPPRGIVQLVHGMAEHIGRYDHFAQFLDSQGFVVCANDHIGHGKTARSEEELGHMPVEGGKEILLADVHELRKRLFLQYPASTPYFLFGHSMGSFIVRAYLARHGAGLSGAILCGTGNQPLALSMAGNFLAKRIANVQGERTRSTSLHNMGAGAFAKKIKNAVTDVDWISTDPAVVKQYLEDKLCGFMFSVGGYATLTSLTAEVVKLSCAQGVPKDLPVLFVAGEEDPVGECGKGVRAAAQLFQKAGVKEVELKLYPGMRHEILNEKGKEEVYSDILSWIEKHVW